MKRAEIVTGVILILFSIWTAWLSTDLPIGWVSGRGPGGGFFPFWLSIVMIISCLVIVGKALAGNIPKAWIGKPYFDTGEMKIVALHAGSILVALGLIYIIGVYGSIFLLIIFHMKAMKPLTGIGRNHSWSVTMALAILTPIAIFMFFEILMQQIMPKGLTEPLFNPIFGFFNS